MMLSLLWLVWLGWLWLLWLVSLVWLGWLWLLWLWLLWLVLLWLVWLGMVWLVWLGWWWNQHGLGVRAPGHAGRAGPGRHTVGVERVSPAGLLLGPVVPAAQAGQSGGGCRAAGPRHRVVDVGEHGRAG